MDATQEQLLIDTLRQLDGKVTAACAAVRALIIHSTDADGAIRAVVAQLEELTAPGVGKPVLDGFVDGVVDARRLLLPSDEDLNGRT